MAEHLEPDDPGMHTTATIDYGVVLSGQATLELDDGAKVDTRARRHRTSRTAPATAGQNAGNVPAVLAVFIFGADHDQRGLTAHISVSTHLPMC